MKRFLRLTAGLYAILVVWGLSFAGMQLRMNDACGDDAGEIGWCPPYTEESCNSDCFSLYGTFGSCNNPIEKNQEFLGYCCMCAV